MQTVSSLYTSIFRGEHTVIRKAVINGVTYTEADIISLKTTGALFDGTPTAGGCVASQITLMVTPKGETIPPMAEIDLYACLTDGERTSEWIRQGVYFIDTRKTERRGEIPVLTVNGFDCIMKLEQLYYPKAAPGWPKTMKACADDIAQLIGTTVDSRSGVSQSFTVQMDTTLTMRQYLSYIAAAHAGTWISAPDGQLRLVSIFDIPDDSNYLVDEWGSAIVFGDTRILV